MLLTSTREWPWGLVVLADPADLAPVPRSFDGQVAISTDGTVVSRILHGIDGPATATVDLDGDASDLPLVYSCQLRLVSGRLRLGDAADEETSECGVPAGSYAVTVYADDPQHPTRVHFDLRRGEG